MKKMKVLLLMMLAALVLSACGGTGFYETNAITGKTAMEQKDSEYLVYFYMPTCVHCQEFKPTMEEYVAQENALPVYKVNLALGTEKESWIKYQVEGTPTLMHVQEEKGEKVEVDRLVGVQKLENIPVKGE